MFESLVLLTLSPTLICLFYIFIRDKYEKEPVNLLFTGVFFGVLISCPIILLESRLIDYAPEAHLLNAFYLSFFVASFVEESFKLVILYLLIRRNKEFNEPFDAIVYSVFISLGFAGVENFLYVFNPELGGFQTAYLRAIFSVPAHGLFGVSMGYYFNYSKFGVLKNFNFIFYSLTIPFLYHGIYDFILLSRFPYYMFIFFLFFLFLLIDSLFKMKKLLNRSPFKN